MMLLYIFKLSYNPKKPSPQPKTAPTITKQTTTQNANPNHHKQPTTHHIHIGIHQFTHYPHNPPHSQLSKPIPKPKNPYIATTQRKRERERENFRDLDDMAWLTT